MSTNICVVLFFENKMIFFSLEILQTTLCISLTMDTENLKAYYPNFVCGHCREQWAVNVYEENMPSGSAA